VLRRKGRVDREDIFYGAMSDEWLDNMFQGKVGWVFTQGGGFFSLLFPLPVHLWFVLSGIRILYYPNDFIPSHKLDRGLFYVNSFEP